MAFCCWRILSFAINLSSLFFHSGGCSDRQYGEEHFSSKHSSNFTSTHFKTFNTISKLFLIPLLMQLSVSRQTSAARTRKTPKHCAKFVGKSLFSQPFTNVGSSQILFICNAKINCRRTLFIVHCKEDDLANNMVSY